MSAQNKVIKQYRCDNPELPHRIIDPALYGDREMQWFADPNLILPDPMRLIMIQAYRCYLCGEMQLSADTIHQENVGEHPYGYQYCTDCKPYFRKGLFNQIAPLWRLRLQYEDSSGYDRSPVWVARTRHDANGVRVRTGPAPYLYTQWTIVRWIPTKYVDKYRVQHDPTYIGYDYSVVVESLSSPSEPEPLTKLVSVKDVFVTNHGSIATPAYDPNVDDPLNKYSESEKTRMFELARDAAIFI